MKNQSEYTAKLRTWMKDNSISIHKLAKYIGVTPAYFNTVLTTREDMPSTLRQKCDDAMAMEDVSIIRDMAYLKIPFTRDEWKRVKQYWKTDEELISIMHDRIMVAVRECEAIKENV